ncbi:MAG: DUF116 domain-containing protein [Chloroflexi bacterium]|nr:DUF116 domain-containing protein [Chloroflexota bacterium]
MKIVDVNYVEERLLQVPPSERILLLPHCLRPSQNCSGKYNKRGLQCPDDCTEDCTTGRLRRAALHLGYKGVCIAPGGRLAINYVKETRPEAIVAVACQKELEAGIHAVQQLGSNEGPAPVIAIASLTRDGCVDTEVDEERALELIALGCSPAPVKSGSR